MNHITLATGPTGPYPVACGLWTPETVHDYGRRENNEEQDEIWQEQPKV
ncbi:MAG: hypothetical protein RIC19_18580 [Phaeodactylibacter sp.]